ncbi:hypothetical protein Emag_005039 [Eimeria magna]
MADSATRAVVDRLPLCSVNAGPRSPQWKERLKEEYVALINYLTIAKENDKEWFKIEANAEGTESVYKLICLLSVLLCRRRRTAGSDFLRFLRSNSPDPQLTSLQ